MVTHYRRPWAESRGDAYDAWGPVAYYFETDEDGVVLRQVEVYDNGPTLRYDQQHPVDEFGFLADQPLNADEFAPYLTTRDDFERAWTRT